MQNGKLREWRGKAWCPRTDLGAIFIGQWASGRRERQHVTRAAETTGGWVQGGKAKSGPNKSISWQQTKSKCFWSYFLKIHPQHGALTKSARVSLALGLALPCSVQEAASPRAGQKKALFAFALLGRPAYFKWPEKFNNLFICSSLSLRLCWWVIYQSSQGQSRASSAFALMPWCQNTLSGLKASYFYGKQWLVVNPPCWRIIPKMTMDNAKGWVLRSTRLSLGWRLCVCSAFPAALIPGGVGCICPSEQRPGILLLFFLGGGGGGVK